MKKILFIVAFIVLIHLLSASSVVFNPSLYEYYQDKHQVGIEDKESINAQMIAFFQGKQDVPPVFNEREISHLIDVKQLIQHLGLAFSIAFLLVIWLLVSIETPRVVIMKGAIGALVVIALFALVPFQYFFDYFHGLFFTAGTWQFPEGSFLTTLYPLGFFLDMFLVVVYRIIGISLLLLLGVTTKRFIYKVSILQ